MMKADLLPVKVEPSDKPSYEIDLDNAAEPADKPQPAHLQKLKRKDTQGIRTVAIFSVLCFNIWPKVFTSGYLGVDMFYVISGYLTARILSKHSQLSSTIISRFYTKQIQRVVPIYALVIYAILHAGSFLLSPEDFRQMRSDAISALTFSTNFQNIFKDNYLDNYFAHVSTYRFFLHTWLLAVEMQFYLLAPFIYYFLLKPCWRSRAAWISSVVMIASFGLQIISSKAIASSLVFCRFWQFFAGIMAFLLRAENRQMSGSGQKENDLFSIECVDETKGLLQMDEIGGPGATDVLHANQEMSTSLLSTMLNFLPNLLLSLLLLVLITPWLFGTLQMELLQVFVVLSTGCLLYLGSFQTQMPYLLTNRASVEAGNASYIWYLIHWPAIQFTIYWSAEGVLNVFDGLLIFMVTLGAAVAINLVIDSRIRKLTSFKAVLMVIAALYAFCLIFIIPPETFHHASSEESDPFYGNGLSTELTTFPALSTKNLKSTDRVSQVLNVTVATVADFLTNATTGQQNSTV